MDTDEPAGQEALEFGPRRGRLARQGVLSLALGALVLAMQAAGEARGENPLVAVSGLVMLGFGLLTLLGLARGRPRLRVDRAGLTLHGALRTRRADWAALGDFALVPVGRGRLARRRFQAVAPGAGGPGLTLPDAFEVPLADLLAAAVALRPATLATPGAVAETPGSRGVEGFRWPWLTAAMLAAQIAVFAFERLAGPGAAGDPSLATLVAMGGVSRDLVASGEAWRLMTAPLLHAGAVHLLANAVAFALAGYALERLVGRAWMFCVFSAGALGGSLASIALNPPSMVSVGASGAIMAMLAALLLASVRMPAGRLRTNVQWQAARTAIPALVPFGHGAGGLHVDYGAHLGGAVVGGVLGLLLLRSWRDHLPLPGRRTAAAGLALAFAAAFAASGVAAALGFPARAALAADLIPDAQVPRDGAAIAAAADRLLAEYPRDPRSHLLAATQMMRRGEMPAALAELRAAVPLLASHPHGLPAPLPNVVHATTAIVLYAQGDKAGAAAEARPACAPAPGAEVSPNVAAALARFGLCPAR